MHSHSRWSLPANSYLTWTGFIYFGFAVIKFSYPLPNQKKKKKRENLSEAYKNLSFIIQNS